MFYKKLCLKIGFVVYTLHDNVDNVRWGESSFSAGFSKAFPEMFLPFFPKALLLRNAEPKDPVFIVQQAEDKLRSLVFLFFTTSASVVTHKSRTN